MYLPPALFIPFAIWVIVAIIVANWGATKEIGYYKTFFISLVLSPAIAVICIVLSPKKEEPREVPPVDFENENEDLKGNKKELWNIL